MRLFLSDILGENGTVYFVSPAFRGPVRTAIVLQVVATVLLLATLDGGVLAKAGAAAMVGFWAGTATAMFRRPHHPTRLDLLCIRWGFVPLLILGAAFMLFMGALRRQGGISGS